MNNIEDIYELSPMQEGILFHILYSPELNLYWDRLTIHLKGNLDVKCFQHAWEKVVERHPAYRTGFFWQEAGKPLQVVFSQVKLCWRNHDWTLFSESEQQSRIEELIQTRHTQVVNIEDPPLMKFDLIRLTENSYQFIIHHHHLISDGWSLPITFREVSAYYKSFANNKKLFLKPTRPYRDYILWLQRQKLLEAERFWKQDLYGVSSPTFLNFDLDLEYSDSVKTTYGCRKLKLSSDLTKSLTSFARRYALTLNTLIQGTWALLLNQYNNYSDVVFGVTLSDRPPELSGIEFMVGLFINTLPIRVKIESNAQFVLWLKQLQKRQSERAKYVYTPLVNIQNWSDIPKQAPLFESLIVFENYPIEDGEKTLATDFSWGQVKSFETNNYPLTLTIVPSHNLLILASFNCHRFRQKTIDKILQDWQSLLMQVADSPEKIKIDEILLKSQIEKQENQTNKSFRSLSPFDSLKELKKNQLNLDAPIPRDQLEISLGEAFSTVLNIHSISVKDDFFELGGNSILSIRLLAQIYEKLEVKIPLYCLFQNPTIEQLASHIFSHYS